NGEGQVDITDSLPTAADQYVIRLGVEAQGATIGVWGQIGTVFYFLTNDTLLFRRKRAVRVAANGADAAGEIAVEKRKIMSRSGESQAVAERAAYVENPVAPVRVLQQWIVILAGEIRFDVSAVPTETGDLKIERRVRALGRMEELVAAVVRKARSDAAVQEWLLVVCEGVFRRHELVIDDRLTAVEDLTSGIEVAELAAQQLVRQAAVHVIHEGEGLIVKQVDARFVEAALQAEPRNIEPVERIVAAHVEAELPHREVGIRTLGIERVEAHAEWRVEKIRFIKAGVEVLAPRADVRV